MLVWYMYCHFFCIKERGSVSYEEADFAKRKSWEVAIFQQKLQYDMTGSFKIRGNRSERFYAKFNVYLYRAIKKKKQRSDILFFENKAERLRIQTLESRY